jgi:uncharacterized protein YndB with AHSA1/START domain
MSEATLQTAGDRPVLRFERHLPDPIETVWRTTTDLDEMRAWFPTRMEIDEWKAGASITHHFEEPGVGPLSGTVLEWQPPHTVSFTWGEDPITFQLQSAPDGGTLFVLTEEINAAHAARNAAGWESCLDRLEFNRETESWTSRFNHYVAIFEPVLGHQDGPPEAFDVS